jgi:RyR domain
MTTYQPTPIDTGSVTLPKSLEGLIERLAENSHDVWAAKRRFDGWTYGPARNDEAKKHPCLVPYAELPESEKEYDRRMAEETIKAIITLGYRILPPP